MWQHCSSTTILGADHGPPNDAANCETSHDETNPSTVTYAKLKANCDTEHFGAYHLGAHHIGAHNLRAYHCGANHYGAYHRRANNLRAHNLRAHNLRAHNIRAHHVTAHYVTAHHFTADAIPNIDPYVFTNDIGTYNLGTNNVPANNVPDNNVRTLHLTHTIAIAKSVLERPKRIADDTLTVISANDVNHTRPDRCTSRRSRAF